jgi:hypothetical protein
MDSGAGVLFHTGRTLGERRDSERSVDPMTSQIEDTRKPDDLELEAEEIKDLDVDERILDEVRGGNSAGATHPGPSH